ncbi:hypothetical protein [Bradyrhizobium sp. BR 1432]|uniref:hypothetical protein n=1 Tax=Bradyrhizobium sp. BR 1432 TaxID=3447966 RepID=UPI003EE746CD
MENQLPDPVPISKAELDVIELYFGDLLDSVLKPAPQAMLGTTATARKEGDK